MCAKLNESRTKQAGLGRGFAYKLSIYLENGIHVPVDLQSFCRSIIILIRSNLFVCYVHNTSVDIGDCYELGSRKSFSAIGWLERILFSGGKDSKYTSTLD